MLDNYANRVRFVRSLTKLSREAFEQKYRINRNTLKSWELGVNTLTEKSAIILSDAINQEGFSCSPQWLIFGQGTEPRPLNQENEEILLDEINQQSKLIYEADYFKKNNPHSIVYMISDKSMLPEYKPGDYVGGINIDFTHHLDQLTGLPCIVSIKNGNVLVRKLLRGKNKHFHLCPINTQFEADIVKSEDIIFIANIIWYRATATRQANDH